MISHENHFGILLVSSELLLDALALPRGTVISDAYRDHGRGGVVIAFLIEEDSLPVAPASGDIPEVVAVMQRNDNAPVTFKEWKIWPR